MSARLVFHRRRGLQTVAPVKSEALTKNPEKSLSELDAFLPFCYTEKEMGTSPVQEFRQAKAGNYSIADIETQESSSSEGRTTLGSETTDRSFETNNSQSVDRGQLDEVMSLGVLREESCEEEHSDDLLSYSTGTSSSSSSDRQPSGFFRNGSKSALSFQTSDRSAFTATIKTPKSKQQPQTQIPNTNRPNKHTGRLDAYLAKKSPMTKQQSSTRSQTSRSAHTKRTHKSHSSNTIWSKEVTVLTQEIIANMSDMTSLRSRRGQQKEPKKWPIRDRSVRTVLSHSSKSSQNQSSHKRGKSFERDISKAIFQTAALGAEGAHFVAYGGNKEHRSETPDTILGDLGSLKRLNDEGSFATQPIYSPSIANEDNLFMLESEKHADDEATDETSDTTNSHRSYTFDNSDEIEGMEEIEMTYEESSIIIGTIVAETSEIQVCLSGDVFDGIEDDSHIEQSRTADSLEQNSSCMEFPKTTEDGYKEHVRTDKSRQPKSESIPGPQLESNVREMGDEPHQDHAPSETKISFHDTGYKQRSARVDILDKATVTTLKPPKKENAVTTLKPPKKENPRRDPPCDNDLTLSDETIPAFEPPLHNSSSHRRHGGGGDDDDPPSWDNVPPVGPVTPPRQFKHVVPPPRGNKRFSSSAAQWSAGTPPRSSKCDDVSTIATPPSELRSEPRSEVRSEPKKSTNNDWSPKSVTGLSNISMAAKRRRASAIKLGMTRRRSQNISNK